MAGCFGNHPFDRAMEQQLNRYLDSLDAPYECPYCDTITKLGDLEQDTDNEDVFYCPNCQKQVKY